MKLIDRYAQFKATKFGALSIKSIPWGLGYIVLFALPLADMRTCELPNGDQIKSRQVYFYSIIGDVSKVIFWHSNANNGPPFSSKSWYVTKEGFKFSVDEDNSGIECYRHNVLGDLIYLFADGFFLKIDHKLLSANLLPTPNDKFPRGIYYEWELSEQDRKFINQSLTTADIPKEKAEIKITDEEIDKQLRNKYDLDDSLLFSYRYFWGKYGIGLYKEYGFELAQGNCRNSAGDCPIAAVWQTHSTDNGKTWSKPIITKDAKLFVIGKSIKEQPGVAKDRGTLKYIGWF